MDVTPLRILGQTGLKRAYCSPLARIYVRGKIRGWSIIETRYYSTSILQVGSKYSQSFWRTKLWSTTLPGARVSRQRQWVGGGCQLRKFKKGHFKKLLLVVVKLTTYVRNVISFSFKPKIRWNSKIWKLFGDIFNFGLCFPDNQLFWGSAMFMSALWRHIRWIVVLILVYMEKTAFPT